MALDGPAGSYGASVSQRPRTCRLAWPCCLNRKEFCNSKKTNTWKKNKNKETKEVTRKRRRRTGRTLGRSLIIKRKKNKKDK